MLVTPRQDHGPPLGGVPGHSGQPRDAGHAGTGFTHAMLTGLARRPGPLRRASRAQTRDTETPRHEILRERLAPDVEDVRSMPPGGAPVAAECRAWPQCGTSVMTATSRFVRTAGKAASAGQVPAAASSGGGIASGSSPTA